MTGSSLFTGSCLSAPKTLSKKSVSITTASIIKPAPYLVSEISKIVSNSQNFQRRLWKDISVPKWDIMWKRVLADFCGSKRNGNNLAISQNSTWGPTHPAMRPTVETVEEKDDTPLTASLVNTPYIVEQLFPLSATALSQNTLPAASPVTAPVSVQTPTFQSDIAASKHRANDHSPDATPRTMLSPSPEPFRPAPPPYVASTLDGIALRDNSEDQAGIMSAQRLVGLLYD
ncbi:hypothetical protein C8R44DRAFT_753029 [Mycena epipterygia]|nr:hypothetical protein C8R44DRAFT_753029 [Mycena epipterygia]